MLKLTKKVEYGLIAMIHMADLPRGELATAREISDRYHVPGELLGKILQALVRANLVASAQGAKGGYRLIRPLEKITVGEIVEIVDGPVHLSCCQDDPANCGQFDTCNIKKPVLEMQKQLVDYMHSLPLSGFRKSVVGDKIAMESGG
jgi:Rrf2 family protein